MLSEKGTGQVLSESPMRAKSDPGTKKDKDTLRNLVLLLCADIASWGVGAENQYVGWASARAIFPFLPVT